MLYAKHRLNRRICHDVYDLKVSPKLQLLQTLSPIAAVLGNWTFWKTFESRGHLSSDDDVA